MKMLRWCLLSLVLVASAAEIRAQGVLLQSPYGFSGGISYSRGGLGRGLRLSLSFGGPAYAFAPGGGFCGPYGWPCPPQISPIITPPPVVVFTPPPLFFEGPRLPPQEAPPVPEIPQPPPPVPPPAPLPKKEDPKNPKKEDDPFAGLPRPPAARSNEADEHDRQVRQGEEAFKAFEYGRAAQCFRKAIQLRPNKPLPHFLLVQSLIALAKYHEAHDALIEGLALHPTWPTMAFRPIEMYDDPVEYSEHLGAVEATLGRHPREPVLLMLLGYQLWFDGRKDDAARLFQNARNRDAQRSAIECFIRALPPGETL